MGATAVLPSLPLPATALATPATTAAAAPAFTAHTYQWAEMIVRAHNSCNIGLLQRSLLVDAAAASALKDSLITNGIVYPQANAYGIHKAVKPLYDGAFVSVSETSAKVQEVAEKVGEFIEDHVEPETIEEKSKTENESDINALPSETESVDQNETLDEMTQTHLTEQDEMN